MGISLNSLVDTANPQMYHLTYNQNVEHFSGKVVAYKEEIFNTLQRSKMYKLYKYTVIGSALFFLMIRVP